MGAEAYPRICVLNNIVIVEPQIMVTGLLIIDNFLIYAHRAYALNNMLIFKYYHKNEHGGPRIIRPQGLRFK